MTTNDLLEFAMSSLNNNWYRCSIDRKQLKALSKRSDRQPLLWFGAYFLILIGLGVGVAMTWQSALFWPFFIAYSFVWGFFASGVHETCHGTPFRTRWLNELSLWMFGLMGQMEPVFVRWGHAGHHSFTHFDEGDTELSEPNPVSWMNLFMVGSGLSGFYFYWKMLIGQAFNYFTPDMRKVIPDSEVSKAVRNARIMLSLYGLVVVSAVLLQSWLPIVLFLLPRLIGGPIVGLLHLTQHTGLQMNVQDHRYSTRSFTASPITRFFYFNMNHHIEHHMFPMVPFYNLPKLNAAIREQLPEPCQGLIGVYKEVLPAVARQQHEPGYFIKKTVPAEKLADVVGDARPAFSV